MPELSLEIGRNNYRIACGQGEEEKLFILSKRLNNRVQSLQNSLGKNANDSLLLVMAALTLEDMLENNKPDHELSEAVNRAEQEKIINTTLTTTLNAISEYIEKISSRLEETINKAKEECV